VRGLDFVTIYDILATTIAILLLDDTEEGREETPSTWRKEGEKGS